MINLTHTYTQTEWGEVWEEMGSDQQVYGFLCGDDKVLTLIVAL